MLIALRIICARPSRCFARWHDNFGVGLLGQYCVGLGLTSLGSITHEGLKGRVNLIKHAVDCRRVTRFWRGQFTCQYLVLLINRHMQLAPRYASENRVFRLMPLVPAVDL